MNEIRIRVAVVVTKNNKHRWSKSTIKKRRKRKWRLSRRFTKPINELLQRLDGPRGFTREKVKGGGGVGGGRLRHERKKNNYYEFTTTDNFTAKMLETKKKKRQ
jgi:hypothetical protein